jgi:hypothetical protein
MPLSLSRKATFEVELDGAKFTFRHPSAAEYAEACDTLRNENVKTMPSVKAVLEAFDEHLAARMIRWEGVLDDQEKPVPFDANKLKGLLTYDELWALFEAWCKGCRVSTEQAKKSVSP